MEFKCDVNQMVDKMCRAERVIGEQAFTISKLDSEVASLKTELMKAKKEIDAVTDENNDLRNEVKKSGESIAFWYGKAVELGFEVEVN